ncbi:ATP-binding protein [Thalassomonas actiniarum]|uniref:histidine kinase n=1 Tax=Thalassomonas actiniarum TaxID=485447 RepID=A0AAE9YWB0_9GAMM|nr:ATP-binding protein [Thalassomonas actiniarum]WDE01554.1 HAMP domain-containing protein [Thalassomonas actiniarum]
MTRLFISLYMGILATFMVFILVAHLINTFLIIDIENIIDAEQFSAEVALLERLDAHISRQEREQLIAQIAEKNQLVIEQVAQKEIPETILAQLNQHPVWFDDDEYNYFKAFTPVLYYRLGEDENHELLLIDDDVGMAIFIAFIVFIALNCFIWLYGLHRKLRYLENTADKISRGQLDQRAPTKKSLTVGRLNLRFNEMAERIEQLLLGHKRLTQAVAHELRSPLFRLQLQIDLLEHASEEDRQAHLRSLEEDVFQLDELVDEFLEYGKMQRSELVLKNEPVLITPFVEALCENLAIEARSRESQEDEKPGKDNAPPIMLEITTGSDTRLLADKGKLSRALNNLIRNAIKYGKKQIKLKVYCQQDSLVFSVEDDGEGIPEQYREKIFQPYFRLSGKNHHRVSGYGLGLTICREIAALHKGDLRVEQSDVGGAAFKLAIPLD